MIHNEKYLVLDDVVYSTTHILLELMAKVYLKFYENSELLETADDETINNFASFNIAMTRPVDDYIVVSEELLDWLLSQFSSLDDVIVRSSPIMALVGAPEVICVYQPKNKLENLAIRKLGLNKYVDKNSLIDDIEFFKQLDELKKEAKDDRPSILTANQNVLNNYGEDFPILAPVNFPWFPKNTVGVVEVWGLDSFKRKDEKEKEENGN